MASSEMEMAATDDVWCRETVPRVMELVSPRLPQHDACALLAVSPWCYRVLVANPKLWEVRIVYSPNELRLLLRILS
jgi:F-box and leucine-rich repeat protein 2/20